jgi:hypothetical protein
MSDTNSYNPDQLLDRVIVALRDEPVPEFHDPFVDESESVAIRHDVGCQVVGRGRRPSRAPVVVAAVAIIAALIVVVSSIVPSATSNVAFAQVQEAISKVQSMSCRFLDFHGDKDPLITTSVSVAGLGAMGEGPNGWISITNLRERRTMWIDHRARKAQISELYFEPGEERRTGGWMDAIRNLPASGAKQLEPATFEGKQVLRFVFESAGDYMVFVDPATNLPVRMELTIERGLPGGNNFREVVTDFVFDAPVEESLFEIKAPPGYAVQRREEPKNRKPLDTRTFVVTAGQSFGPVPLGASKEKVIADFGPPDLTEETYRGPRTFSAPGQPVPGQPEVVDERLSYHSLGFIVNVSSDGVMTGVECLGPGAQGNSARAFLGQTDKGIGFGASIDEVIKAYGKPDVQTHLRGDMLHYFRKGCTFSFQDRKLTTFEISKPQSEDIEITDNGDGSWTLSVKPKKKP